MDILRSERFTHYFFKVGRFLVSGGSAAATNLLVYYISYSLLHIYYILSSTIAFAISFVVSFTMQKFWTFRDESLQVVNIQLSKYLTVALVNLGINTSLLYCMVEFLHVHKLTAQIIAMIVISFWSFFIYQFLIFRRVPEATANEGEVV